MTAVKEVCANCGWDYAHHVQTTQCYPDSTAKWFPNALAKAPKKQRRRIHQAQIDLGEEHAAKKNSASHPGQEEKR
jgi:hypothetical protein